MPPSGRTASDFSVWRMRSYSSSISGVASIPFALTSRLAVGVALELREQVEARQRAFEVVAQATAHARLDHVGTGQQAQPELQCTMVVVVDARLMVEHRGEGAGVGIAENDVGQGKRPAVR